MLFNRNLEEIIFHRHQTHQSDELIILSGYVGPNPIARLKELPFKTTVIFGMYGDRGIQEKLHNSLVAHQNNISNVDIYYSNIPVHSKCYIWKNNNTIHHALIGSANFSTNGLSTPYRETLAETTFDTFDPLDEYIKKIMENSVICTEIELNLQRRGRTEERPNIQVSTEFCRMTLLDRNGQVASASGLNWGQGQGNVRPNDAYIAIKKDYLREYPDLFPPKQNFSQMDIETTDGRSTRHNDKVEIIWDDGVIMDGLLEGNQTENEIMYPKNFSTSPSKDIIGKYIRNRIGVELGRPITIDDLNRYGRTYIDVSLLEDGVYSFDFSVE